MTFFKSYVKKFGGYPKDLKLPPRPSLVVLFFSFIGAFLGISLACAVSSLIATEIKEDPVILGSIGAMAILLYGSIDAPLAQPRNLVVGNVVSALIGVVIQTIFYKITGTTDALMWLKAGLAVSSSLFIMQLTQSVHPPAGATALIAVTGGQKVFQLGFFYLIMPVILNVSILLFVALLVNNIKRQYPRYWWNPELKYGKSFLSILEKDASKAVGPNVPGIDLENNITSDCNPTYDELKEHIDILQKRIELLEGRDLAHL